MACYNVGTSNKLLYNVSEAERLPLDYLPVKVFNRTLWKTDKLFTCQSFQRGFILYAEVAEW